MDERFVPAFSKRIEMLTIEEPFKEIMKLVRTPNRPFCSRGTGGSERTACSSSL